MNTWRKYQYLMSEEAIRWNEQLDALRKEHDERYKEIELEERITQKVLEKIYIKLQNEASPEVKKIKEAIDEMFSQ